MNKEEALRTIVDCAKQFQNNLVNCNVLFVFADNDKINFLETLFLPRHYMHLTGITLLNNNIKSVNFYNMCLSGRLDSSIFILNPNGTTEMKLSVLSQAVNIHKTARMIGTYNLTKSMLITEKIVGTITACLGFVPDNGYYIPNTILREDIRDVVCKPTKRILAIYKKSKNTPYYTSHSYVAKDVNMADIEEDLILKNKFTILQIK